MYRGSKKSSGISPDGCLQSEERTSGHPGKAAPYSGAKLLSEAKPWQEVALSR